MTAPLYALIRVMSLTYISSSCENNTVRNHSSVLRATSSSHFRMHSPWKCDFAAPAQKWSLFSTPWNVAGLVTWLVGCGGSNVVQLLEFKPQEALSPWNAMSKEAWDERSGGERGPQGPHGLNVVTWMSPGKISRRTTQPTESWKTITYCCFQPLNCEVICFTATDNHTCLVIYN